MKLVNAERAAIKHAPDFKGKMMRTGVVFCLFAFSHPLRVLFVAKQLLSEISKEFLSNKVVKKRMTPARMLNLESATSTTAPMPEKKAPSKPRPLREDSIHDIDVETLKAVASSLVVPENQGELDTDNDNDDVIADPEEFDEREAVIRVHEGDTGETQKQRPLAASSSNNPASPALVRKTKIPSAESATEVPGWETWEITLEEHQEWLKEFDNLKSATEQSTILGTLLPLLLLFFYYF